MNLLHPPMLLAFYFLFTDKLATQQINDSTQQHSVHVSQWKMWISEAIIFICFCAACAAQGSEDAPPVPVVHLQSKWVEIFSSEQVTLRCEIQNSSSWTINWYKDEKEVQNTDRGLIFSGDQSLVRVTSQAQSGKYSCKGVHNLKVINTPPSNSVQITVHANKPKPALSHTLISEKPFVGESVTFKCSLDVSSTWDYLWSFNGQQIPNSDQDVFTIQSLKLLDSGQYYCKVRRDKGPLSTESDAVRLEVVDAPVPTAKLLSQWSDVFVNEELLLGCGSVSADWNFTWFRNGEQIKEDPSVNITEEGAKFQISSASESHKDLDVLYKCKAHHKTRPVSSRESQPITIKVYGTPKPTLTKNPPYNKMYVGEIVNFTCHIDISSGWTYKWYKKDKELGTTSSTISFPLGLSDRGDYLCKAFRGGLTTESSDKIYQDVIDVPVPSVSSLSPLSSVFVNERVTLQCNVASTDWGFTWYKNGGPPSEDGVLKINEHGGELLISSASEGHAGAYSCKGRHKTRDISTGESQPVTLNVSGIPVPSVKHLTEWLDVFPTETVKLSCGMTSGSTDWTYEWLKDNQKIQDDNSVVFDTVRANLTIRSASASHKGQYKCKGILKGRQVTTDLSTGLTLTVYDQKPRPVLIQDPEYSIMFNGEPVSFTCHINISNGWEFEWYSDNIKFNFNLNNYSVSSLDKTNSGSYTCKARRGKTHSFITDASQAKELQIKDQPKPVMSQMPDVEKVYTGETVIFTCEVKISSDWDYLWYINGNPANGSHSYSVTSATPSDVTVYKCKAKRRKTKFLTEDSEQKAIRVSEIPVPSVKHLTEWLDVFPTETVELGCGMETGSSDWLYNWQKDGQAIQSDKSLSFSKDTSTLTIDSSASHDGEYRCTGKLKERSVQSNFSLGLQLKVYEAKPSIILEQDPEYNVSYTSDSVTFSCGVNLSSGWKYQWYKDNSLVSSDQNYTIASLQTSHTGKYTCQAKRGTGKNDFLTEFSRTVKIEVHERPAVDIILLTGWSEVFSTDSLMLKCQVKDSGDEWKYKWFKGDQEIPEQSSEKHTVTPQNDPDQSQYMCQGIRNGRPAYTKHSEPFKTNNLLLKRRVLLSISGCLLFGICAVFLGCILLRVLRKPVVDQERPEEASLFLTMAELKERGDAPSPLVEYVTDEDLKDLAKVPPTKEDENGTICSETTPLPIASKEDDASPSEDNNATENGGMVSFKK